MVIQKFNNDKNKRNRKKIQTIRYFVFIRVFISFGILYNINACFPCMYLKKKIK